MRSLVVAAALALTLTACSSGEENSPAPAAESSPTPAAKRTLLESCPEIEAALLPDSDLASADELKASAEDLGAVYEAGDTESRNALELLVDPLAGVIDVRERDVVGMELLDAMDAFDAAIGSVANRCAAVGSSALQ